MRELFRRPVRTAVALELVDLAVQAVDGTNLAANAAMDRTYSEEKLGQLLERLDKAIEDLEAQNQGGEDGVPVRLPEQLASQKALRERVRQAVEELPDLHRPSRTKRPKRINLTDRDARLLKTRQGILPAYNGQAMVSPLVGGLGMTGMLVTAADLVDEPHEHGQLIPMMKQAEEITGTKAAMTLADSGYFAGSALEECARRGQQVVVPEKRERHLEDPYHKDRFVHDEATDTYMCPQGQTLPLLPYAIRQPGLEPCIPYVRSYLPAVPRFRHVYHGGSGGPHHGHRPPRHGAAPATGPGCPTP